MSRPPLAILLVALGSCHVEASCGDTKIDRTKTEALVKQLAEQVDAVELVNCPTDVEAKVGASFECNVTFTAGGRHAAVVTITAVDGTDVSASAVWRTPLFGDKKRAEIEHSISQTVGAAGKLACPGGVHALAPAKRLRCTIVGTGGLPAPVDIWHAADDQLNWKLNPDDAPAEAPPAEAPAP